MSDDSLKMLLQSLGRQLSDAADDPSSTVAMLLTETIRFRDKLKEESGKVLTVGETRQVLDALDEYLSGRPPSESLTSEQKALLQIYIRRLTVFRKK
jgi:hypothetical protein